MHSRRDQVAAHAFLTGRLRSALLRAEPDAARPPLRRTPLGLAVGLVAGLLVAAAVVVLALVSPGSSARWRQPGALLVEKQTGTRYVLTGGRLHPVVNHASARLLLGARMTVVPVNAKTLSGLPRGAPVGIPDAPDSIPDPRRAGDQPWLACAGTATAPDGRTVPALTVHVGRSLPVAASPRDSAVLVRGPDGAVFLAEGGRRHRLVADWVARTLGLDPARAVWVRSAWLDALPAGADLGPLPVGERGAAGPTLDGRPAAVGQVLLAADGGGPARHFLVVGGGLMPVPATAVALALGDPQAPRSYGGRGAREVVVSPSAVAAAPAVSPAGWVAALPDVPRVLPEVGGRVPCVQVSVTGRVPVYAVVLGADPGAPAVAVPGVRRDDRTADRVGVPPGGGALARTLPVPGVTGAGLFLVVETGVKYPLDEDAARSLGYAPEAAAAVPPALLATLPTGPALHRLEGGGA